MREGEAMTCDTCAEPYSTKLNPDHPDVHIEGTKEWQRQQIWYMRESQLNWGEIAAELNISSSRVKRLFNEVCRRELR